MQKWDTHTHDPATAGAVFLERANVINNNMSGRRQLCVHRKYKNTQKVRERIHMNAAGNIIVLLSA